MTKINLVEVALAEGRQAAVKVLHDRLRVWADEVTAEIAALPASSDAAAHYRASLDRVLAEFETTVPRSFQN